MKKRVTSRCVVAAGLGYIAVLLLAVAAAQLAASTEDLPLPPGVSVSIVGEDMVVNGVPLRAYEYYWAEGEGGLIEEYRRLWRENSDGGAPALIVSSLGDWSLFSHVEGGLNFSVQYRREGIKGLRVLLGVSPLPNMMAKKRRALGRSEMQTPPGMKLLSTVRSTDGGRVHETYWLQASGNATKTAMAIDRHFSSRGYKVKQSKTAGFSPSKTPSLITIRAMGDKDLIEFSVMPSGGASKVIAVWQGR